MSFMALLFRSCTNCHSPSSEIDKGELYGFIAIFLFLIRGVLHSLLRGTRSTSEVAISEIPAEDLEKSPAPILPYNNIPRRQLFVEASSLDLPDYFTTVNNTDEVDVFMEERGWTNASDTPPPSYEQALEMAPSTNAPFAQEPDIIINSTGAVIYSLKLSRCGHLAFTNSSSQAITDYRSDNFESTI